jgi:hypothetical protein
MDEPQFNYRGLRIGLAGVAIVFGAVAVSDWLPNWLLFGAALVGIGAGFVGAGFHYRDMFQQHRAEAEARKAWIRVHGDPDHRDDPAVR